MNITYLLLAILFSGTGWIFFSYGKKQLLFVPMLCGLALMIYPYFVTSTLPLVGIGAMLIAIPWFVRP